MREEDAQLVNRCLTGDADAFDHLVKRYQQSVYATAFYYVGRYNAAEDVSQDAFLSAYKSLPRLDSPERFGPWLKEITCRTASNWLRRNGKKLKNETPLPYKRTISIEDARDTPLQSLEREERFSRVEQAIDSLPERYRLTVVLRYLQELSYRDICVFTGQTHDEVRGVLERATRQLRQVLLAVDEESGGESSWHRV
ncbi:MAG: sigma-70 family RNA polymerase sigma factor [Candidatus Hydrogenedentota bacterium]